jgi:hypothetical protein
MTPLLTPILLCRAVLCCAVRDWLAGALEMESAVNREMDPAVKQQLIKHSKGWRGINNPWMADGDDDEEFQYINLVVNPERYTGYKVGVLLCNASSVLRDEDAGCVLQHSQVSLLVLQCGTHMGQLQ